MNERFVLKNGFIVMAVVLLSSLFVPIITNEPTEHQFEGISNHQLSSDAPHLETSSVVLPLTINDEAYIDTSISVDSMGYVHMISSEFYYDDGVIGSSLIYTTNSTGSWISTPIDDDGQTTHSSMDIDSNDKIHIAYQSNNGYLKYATNVNENWEMSIIQDVHPDMEVGISNDIFVDENNNVHVSYVNELNENVETFGSSDELIMYANNIEGFWNITESPERISTVYDTSIVTDSEMHVYIGFYTFDYFMIKHNNSQDGEWRTSFALTSASSKFSFEIDSQDVIHISYVLGTNRLGYASESSDNLPTGPGNYFETTIIDNDLGYYGGKNSMTIDSRDNLHVAYYDDTGLSIKYATMKDDGVWNISSIESINQIDTYYSSIDIEVQNNGDAHMFYQNWQWSDAGSREGLMKYSKISYLDLDGDGVIYIFDQCPEINATGFDLDADGCIDDDDGDGIRNGLDQCEGHDDSIDVDQDDIVDGCDNLIDNDGDGVANDIDQFPEDSTETNDTDGDGVGDNTDNDDDDDGAVDSEDAFPKNASESDDTDGDGIGNNEDDDDDNDGYSDDLETSFAENSLCRSDPLNSESTPMNNSEINSSDYAYILLGKRGECDIYYDLDGDEVVDRRDFCPDEYAKTSSGCPDSEVIEPSESSDSTSNTTVIISSSIGIAILIASIALVVIRRRRSTELDDQFDDNDDYHDVMTSSFNSPVTDSSLQLPSATARGEITDGYETIEFPEGSGNWFYRDHDTGKWTEWL
ncbi:MAG: hypothetical protein P8Q95_04505 [Candidatus Poseidoniaceae archaeon]|nr:hypothetical protein [Candidatus Poseidoniaceae archaeon]